MAWFHDRTTMAKLLGAFGLLCAVLVAVGAQGLTTAASIESKLAGVTDNDLPTVLALAEVRAATLAAQRESRTAIIESDAAATRAAVDLLSADLRRLDKALTTYRGLSRSATEQRLLAEFETAHTAWRQGADQAIPLILQNTAEGNAAAVELLFRQNAPYANTMNQAVDGMMAENQRQAAEAATHAHADYEQSSRLLVGGVVLAVIFAGATGVFVARGIARPLQAMTAAAQRLALGDVEHSITLERRDEVGQAAAAFRQLIAYQQAMAAVASAVAAGDLTETVTPKSDRDRLGLAFARMTHQLQELIGEVQTAANALAGTSQQLGAAAGRRPASRRGGRRPDRSRRAGRGRAGHGPGAEWRVDRVG